ncbi:hypothetical protein [Streptomyces sp. NPDC007369]|uniref:hypothetical protein n=1 Tax=Streptomyces sp. NPDC007369 TaxID=3154589 RepID=UPI0034033953
MCRTSHDHSPPPSPRTPRDCTAGIHTGYWFEAVCYRDSGDRSPELLYRTMLETPERAVRLVRMQIRTTHPFDLAPAEVDRALAWADGGGRVQALAALHRGERAGFSLVLYDGRRPEWRITPVCYLALTTAPAP